MDDEVERILREFRRRRENGWPRHWPDPYPFGTRYVHSSPSATYGEEEDHGLVSDVDLDREQGGGSAMADVPRSDFPDDAGHRRTGYYSLPGWDGLDCLDVIAALGLNFALGSALKYLWRAGRKTPDRLQDLEKARDFIDREIRRIKGE